VKDQYHGYFGNSEFIQLSDISVKQLTILARDYKH